MIYKVTATFLQDVEGQEESAQVKKEVFVEAELLVEAVHKSIPAFENLTNHKESIVVIKAEETKVCEVIYNQYVDSDDMGLEGLGNPQEIFMKDVEDLVFFQIPVDFYDVNEKNGKEKKVDTSIYIVAAKSIAEAYEFAKRNLCESMMKWKVRSAKCLANTDSVVVDKRTVTQYVNRYESICSKFNIQP